MLQFCAFLDCHTDSKGQVSSYVVSCVLAVGCVNVRVYNLCYFWPHRPTCSSDKETGETTKPNSAVSTVERSDNWWFPAFSEIWWFPAFWDIWWFPAFCLCWGNCSLVLSTKTTILHQIWWYKPGYRRNPVGNSFYLFIPFVLAFGSFY